MSDPIAAFLRRQEVMILDGGLATELEARGADLGGGLWSARLLQDDPDLIRSVHLDFLEAGADCVTTASYQASLQGFGDRGVDDETAAVLLLRSVELAAEARERLRLEPGRLRPLIAASIGPYGAYLADGSEYRGDYDLDEDGLFDFHRRRFEILAASGADLLACETIPSLAEARALARLAARAGAWTWFSFSCRDRRRLHDGSELAAAVAAVAAVDRVAAVGVNCIPPGYVTDLVAEVRRVTGKPVIAYPNSGETWDAGGQRWRGGPGSANLAAAAGEWRRAGAAIVGGCCRTRPGDIRRLRRSLLGEGKR
ncbi:MAG: homocysteine S-methyltransferase [Thermoanaerobaculia bacterium]